MKMPFPGMDPCLEHPFLWPDLHTRLIVGIANYLRPLIRPRYVVSIQLRVYVQTPEQERIPDVMIKKGRRRGQVAVMTGTAVAMPVVIEVPQIEVTEPYLEIRDRYHQRRLVTSLEVVSPSNKKAGPGRKEYLLKQRETLASRSHLVEIDLLRRGRHVVSVPKAYASRRRPTEYLICVNRWPERRRFELYWCGLREPLPKVRLPLAKPDQDVALDIQSVLERAYEDADFGLQVRYHKPCFPRLPAEDQAWATAQWRRYRSAHPELFPAANGRSRSVEKGS